MGVEVCPVHKAEFKSSHISTVIHVDAMSQPRGLKRKHSEEEDEDEGPPRRQQPRLSPQRRQELLDMTYDKLKKTEAEKHPSFRKQVLMTNIVRRLQKDMMRDGIQVNGLTRESTAPVWSEDNNQVSNLDPPPEATNFVGFPIDENGVDRPPTPIPTTDYEIFNNYPSYHQVSSRTQSYEPVALWTEDNDRLSSLNWSSVLKSTVELNYSSDCAMSDESGSITSLHTLMPAVTGIESYLGSLTPSSSPNGSTSPGSGSSSSEDEIFGDVDLTLYDYDYTPLSPPNVAMAPLTAEELMWSLSNGQQKPANSTDDRDYLMT
ncbi:hypothetical protein JTE90_018374 [Oedothorax gibbosus]|uniref:SERTA domain-containing protein n=1 Tax=Oedothorax gibbosus TaxID=931172 RepID=A0AAV6UE71_9ARAC|nr:hypothetical protein JTE90_018374 [Oedothorax gibbosus]